MSTRTAVFLCVAVPCMTAAAMAQSDRGTIKGVVTDQQGLSVQNARIVVSNVATAVAHEARSEVTGNYTVPGLRAGVYRVSCELAGFKTYVAEDVNLDTGRTVAVNVVLQAGAVVESVTVSANPALLDVETSDVGTAVPRQQIMDLPVPLTGDSRNPLSFVVMVPGVSGSVPGATPDFRLHVSGSPAGSSEVFIDGIPVSDTNSQGNINNNHPSIEAIGEFKISNNNQSSDFGLASGMISFTFRSGTNDLHGSVFEFLQNDRLNALDFATKARGGVKAPLKQNEYGFTAGGPVWIPKVYKGRDRTFFFTSYTGFKYRPSANNPNLTTFPNRFRQGDFSQLLGPQVTVPAPGDPARMLPVFDAAGRPVHQGAIYDPTESRAVTGPDGKSYQIRDPFLGNQIPANHPGLSKAAKSLLSMFPAASTDALFNNFVRQTRSEVNQQRFVAKMDHQAGRHYFSGSAFLGTNINSNTGSLGMTDATQNDIPTRQFRLSHNFTISPRTVNNLNFGFLRDRAVLGPVQPGPELSTLGITGITMSPGAPLPQIIIRGQNSIGTQTFSGNVQNRFLVNDNLTLTRGAHALKLGGEVRRLQRNEIPNNTGRFAFEPTQTALNGVGFVNPGAGPVAVSLPASTGNAAASFLFGAPDFTRFDLGVTTKGYRFLIAGGYIQDDWKVRGNLTLNLGFRYDVAVPRTEVLGRVSTVDMGLANPAAGGLPGAYTFFGKGPGRNGRPRIGDIDYKGFQPRVGFAYTPRLANGVMGKLIGSNQTVFRGGFAMSRPLGNDTLQSGITNALYAAGFDGVATVNRPGDAIGSPAFFWDQRFPNFTPPPYLDPALLVGNVNPALILPEAGHPPTQINWTFNVQRSLPGAMVADIGYVGMHAYHLGIWRKPNQIDPAYANAYAGGAASAGLPLNQFLALRITDPRVGNSVRMPYPNFTQLFGAAATVGQALRPFPQYGNIDQLFAPLGSTSYNGLQAKLQKRFAQGLAFLLAYTVSKTIGDVDSFSGVYAGAENALWAASFQQNYYDNRAERSVTSSDIPQVLALSYTYELPFGRGKRFLNRGGLANKLAGGWQAAGIHLYQSGRPIHIEYDVFGADNPYKANDGYSFRPNIVAGKPLVNPRFDRRCAGPLPAEAQRSPCQFYVNPEAFSFPPSGQFGNAGKFLPGLRSMAYYNEDFSVIKRTDITEKVTLKFQANLFNAFNRVVLGNAGSLPFIVNWSPASLNTAALATSNTAFGILTTQQNGPRRIQFALKLEF